MHWAFKIWWMLERISLTVDIIAEKIFFDSIPFRSFLHGITEVDLQSHLTLVLLHLNLLPNTCCIKWLNVHSLVLRKLYQKY